jgi:hypothetical protein
MTAKLHTRHRVIRFIILISTTVLFAGILVFAYSRVLVRSAQAFLDDLKVLRVGKSSFAEIQQLREVYLDVWKKADCKPSQDCALDFAIENTWLHRLRLVPWTKFQGTLYIRDGTLTRMGVILAANTGNLGFGAVVVETPGDIQDQKSYAIRHRRNQKGLPENVSIYLTPTSTATERQQAYGFNLTCLARFGGCKDSSELLPSAWSGT